jgi:TMPIT-like protein
MYTRIALGKSSAMDVVGGESSGMAGQLLVLLPFLYALQVWQVLMGLNMVLQTGHAIINPEGWLVRTCDCSGSALHSLVSPECASTCDMPAQTVAEHSFCIAQDICTGHYLCTCIFR